MQLGRFSATAKTATQMRNNGDGPDKRQILIILLELTYAKMQAAELQSPFSALLNE